MSRLAASELEDLIERIAERDTGAFASFYDRTAPYVFGVLLRMLGRREAAEEVAQEVFTAVWRNAGTYDASRGSPATWIGLIARSRAIDRLRSERSLAAAVERMAAAEQSPAGGGRQADSSAGPEEAFDIPQRRRLVLAAMESLPPEQRSVIELAFFHDLSHSEIARKTETPLGTVKSRIRAAIGKLEDILTPSVTGGAL